VLHYNLPVRSAGSDKGNFWSSGQKLIRYVSGDVVVRGWLLESIKYHYVYKKIYSSQIHEHKFFLKFLGIILEVLRLEVSIYNVYITNKFQAPFSYDFCPNYVQEFDLSAES
jgi:hypothetical protein